MVNKQIVELMVFGLVLVIAGAADADQTKPKVPEPIERETGAKKDSDSCKLETTAQTREKNIREGVDPKILEVLDKLEALGQTVKDLQADLSLEKLETLVDDRSTKEGKLYYQKEKKNIRFRISFEKTRYDGRSRADREDFVFSDGWLTHRQERGEREDRYQYTRPGQQNKDLMRIGKSPLPLLIGQKTEQILKNFEVSLIKANKKTDPAKIETVHLKLVPRKGTELSMSHTRLEFWLQEAEYLLPVRSQWENDSGDIFTADMSKLRINKGMKKNVFKLSKRPRGYEMTAHPLPKEPTDGGKD